MTELLTVQEIARMCRVHEITVRRHISEGRLKAVRVGKGVRVRKEDLEEYLSPRESVPGVVSAGGQGRPRGITREDRLFHLVGIADVKEADHLSEDKYAAFPQAYSGNP